MIHVFLAPHLAAGGTAPQHFGQISAGAAVVCAVVAQLLRWRPLRRLEFLIPWLCLLAGIGFAAAFLGDWVHWLAGLGKAIPVLGVALTVSIAIVLLFIVLYDMWPRHPSNNTTYMAALMLPAFAPEIGGAIGAGLGTVLGGIAVVGANFISHLVGVS